MIQMRFLDSKTPDYGPCATVEEQNMHKSALEDGILVRGAIFQETLSKLLVRPE